MNHKKAVHFIGIAGIGMSGIAEILLRSGYRISGSDLRTNMETDKLAELGAEIFVGHRLEQVPDVQAVVYSSAVPANNPELLEARRRKIPTLPRAEMLAELMRMKRSIVVAGAHGKTTTSAMVTAILLQAGCDPTAVIGGRLKQISGNAKMGTDDWFVAESDESDGSFLRLLPTVAVITNLDREHLDHYGSYAKLEQAFVDFANRVSFDGVVAICADDPGIMAIRSMIEKPTLSYGLSKEADVVAKKVRLHEQGTEFEVEWRGETVGPISLPMAGRHNVRNALGAFVVSAHVGVNLERIKEGLSSFGGIDRRLELKGNVRGIRVFDDYAHHPTEIEATIDALRLMNPKGSIRILFQPHRFSRVGDLWERFLQAFDQVGELVVTPVYGASEKAIAGIDGERLASEIKSRGTVEVRYVQSIDEGAALLCQTAREGDLIVTMGAGDVTRAAPKILDLLSRTQGGNS